MIGQPSAISTGLVGLRYLPTPTAYLEKVDTQVFGATRRDDGYAIIAELATVTRAFQFRYIEVTTIGHVAKIVEIARTQEES